MKVGYAQNVITPSLDRPVFLAGFGNNRRVQTVHDDLFVRALTIQDGPTTLVLAALDLIGFFSHDMRDVVLSLKTSDVFAPFHPEIVIASTHTHHGPDTMGLWGPDNRTCGVDPEYMAATKEKIAGTILTSLSALEPASAKWTSVQVPGVAKNARNPGIVDDELTLAQFSSDGKVLATLFNFPCHPEVLWEHNTNITSDYPGWLRKKVEEQTGAPCIFFAGALGGMMTPDVKDHSFEEAAVMGTKLADAGLKALAKVEGRSPTLSLQKKEIRARLTNVLYKLAFRRRLLPDVRDQEGCIHSEVNLIKLGGLWLATVPGELLPKLGLQIKASLKAAGAATAGVIGLANDELGYILPAEDFKYPWNPFRPGKHYEETNSIGREIGPRVLEGIRTLL
jgi:hypothetical protein